MNTIKFAFSLLISGIFTLAHAIEPVYPIKTLIPPPTEIIEGRSAIALYQITNNSTQSNITISIPEVAGTIVNIKGKDRDNSSNYCSRQTLTLNRAPFEFSFDIPTQKSCLLEIDIIANTSTGKVKGGPIICDEKHHHCSQPAPNEEFNTQTAAVPTKEMPELFIKPHQDIVIKPNQPVTLTIHNLSATTAANKVVPIIPEMIDAKIEGCSLLAPKGGKCTIVLSAKPGFLPAENQMVLIEGANTQTVKLQVSFAK